MANQFNNKLGYLGTWINAEKVQTISATSTFEVFKPVLVDVPSLQYNAEINREGGLIVSDHAPVIIDLNL